ncbi:MAG: hypothetical protein Q9227_008936 [Pyrenula ochraceoflavens]
MPPKSNTFTSPKYNKPQWAEGLNSARKGTREKPARSQPNRHQRRKEEDQRLLQQAIQQRALEESPDDDVELPEHVMESGMDLEPENLAANTAADRALASDMEQGLRLQPPVPSPKDLTDVSPSPDQPLPPIDKGKGRQVESSSPQEDIQQPASSDQVLPDATDTGSESGSSWEPDTATRVRRGRKRIRSSSSVSEVGAGKKRRAFHVGTLARGSGQRRGRPPLTASRGTSRAAAASSAGRPRGRPPTTAATSSVHPAQGPAPSTSRQQSRTENAEEQGTSLPEIAETQEAPDVPET